MRTFSGFPGVQGRTGVIGATGQRGQTGVNIINVKVETPKHRVPRQVAGCPGRPTLILDTEPEMLWIPCSLRPWKDQDQGHAGPQTHHGQNATEIKM